MNRKPLLTRAKGEHIDHEELYRLIFAQRWGAVVAAVHRQAKAVATDPMMAAAVETFVTMFFEALEAAADATAFEEALEKLVLLHRGGFYRLPEGRFEQAVVCLVGLYADRPEQALSYARFCPENEHCAAVIRQFGIAAPEPIRHTQAEALHLAATSPLGEADATIGLFKSQQEVDFFMAVREVFATYFVYPNVALSSLIDYEQIKDRLSGKEHRYFFRALVDCVVFDQHDGYRPRYFFELDSPLHDTEARQEKDRHKERILALAGQTLYRIRKQAPDAGRAAFVKLLKEAIVHRETSEATPRPSPS